MELNYQNCKVIITPAETSGVTFSIYFGETEIYKNMEAASVPVATAKARLLIDEFVGDLPPALSYKH